MTGNQIKWLVEAAQVGVIGTIVTVAFTLLFAGMGGLHDAGTPIPAPFVQRLLTIAPWTFGLWGMVGAGIAICTIEATDVAQFYDQRKQDKLAAREQAAREQEKLLRDAGIDL